MAEYPRPEYLRPGHIFDPAAVRLDLWRLLMLFLGDRSFAELTEPEILNNHQPLLNLHSEFADYEVTRILLSSAIALRVADDRDRGALNAVARTCGELQTNSQEVAHVPLNLREACNKIIHATRINFDIERLDGGEVGRPAGFATYLRPIIYLYGEHRGAEWRASLNILEFVHSAAEVL